jgi:hypothetical protein
MTEIERLRAIEKAAKALALAVGPRKQYREQLEALYDALAVPPADDGEAQPVAYAAGLEANMNGYLDVKIFREGEFTTPLYYHPRTALAVPPADDGEAVAWQEQYEIFKDVYSRYADGEASVSFNDLRISLALLMEALDDAPRVDARTEQIERAARALDEWYDSDDSGDYARLYDKMTALRSALALPPDDGEAVPVAWRYSQPERDPIFHTKRWNSPLYHAECAITETPLYAHPSPRVDAQDSVRIPTSEQEAKAMYSVAKSWLDARGVKPIDAQETERLRKALETIQAAYGMLWSANDEPEAPVPLYPVQKAANDARCRLLAFLGKGSVEHKEAMAGATAARAALSSEGGEG